MVFFGQTRIIYAKILFSVDFIYSWNDVVCCYSSIFETSEGLILPFYVFQHLYTHLFWKIKSPNIFDKR